MGNSDKPDADKPDALEERLGRIEETLTRIEAHLGELSGVPAKPSSEPVSEPTTHPEPEPRKPREQHEPREQREASQPAPEAHTPAEPAEPASREVPPASYEEPQSSTGIAVENWLDKIGIALLLLGLGFLFKLSVELGLMTEPVKVGLGLVVGAGLGTAGWRVRETRRRLAQILMGGSSAAFYITLFAAHQIYELWSQPVAFAGMCAVTMATFVVSERQRDPALALVGAIGGFATPFLLSSGTGNYISLSLYNTILVSGMVAIVLMRDFKSLLAVTGLGGWLVAIVAVFAAVNDTSSGVVAGLTVQFGVLTVWLALGVAPAVRAWLACKAASQADSATKQVAGDSAARVFLVHALTLASPFIALGLMRMLWELPNAVWDVGYVALAVAYLGASFVLERAGSRTLTSNVRVVAGLLLTVAIGDFFSMDNWPVVFAMEAVALGWAARQLDESPLWAASHVLACAAAIWLAADFFTGGATDATAFLNADSARGAGILGSLLAFSYVVRNDAASVMYRYILHGLALLYLHDQASLAAHGDLLATACWGIYAIGLLIAGLSSAKRQLTYVGLATVVLAAAKLLVVDMAGTETIWRVLLFLGFGAALLALSYFAPVLSSEEAK